MIDTPHNTVLLIDKDPEQRTRLSKILSEKFVVDVANTAGEGLSKIMQTGFDLILVDFETLGMQIDLFVRHLSERQLKTRLALMTSLFLEDYISYMKNWNIINVLTKRPTYDQYQTIVTVENFISPERAFGLRRYLPASLKSEDIRSRDDKSYIVSKVINFFGANGYSSSMLYDIRLVLEEMINNAIYHAFRDEYGKEKYRPQTFHELLPNEIVKVDYGAYNEFTGFMVSDNQGRLTPAHIIDTLLRQYDKTGLYDQSGRGLFLSRRFSDVLIINIRNDKTSQIISLFTRNGEKDKNAPKPFYINYVE